MSENKTLKGKTAVITGGSRGIGEACAIRLASLGANVAIIYASSDEAAKNVCDKCQKEYGVEAKAYRLDVADFNAAKVHVLVFERLFLLICLFLGQFPTPVNLF